ncbi:MAG: endonuclease III [Candidatus Norongarragalinales archaeon]
MKKAPVKTVLKRLQKAFAKETAFSGRKMSAFQCLVGTVLSARTKDANTAKASSQLFSKHSTAQKLAKAPLKSIERLIKPAGFYKTKARYVKRLSRMLLNDYGGRVPDTMEELMQLPGVGRKVAGCVLVYAFRKPAIPVDTHVHRISNRLGWVKTKTPEKTEFELMKNIPKNYWIDVNNLLVLHGQKTCLPRNPKCGECVLNDICPSAFKAR